jgi:hypothetical protein
LAARPEPEKLPQCSQWAAGLEWNSAKKRLLVLDTDHLSDLRIPSRFGAAILERIDTSGQDVATTVITVAEQFRGWLSP